MPPRRPEHTIDALYAVGRNVVNFQRLEQILKLLARFAPVYTTPSTFQSELEKRGRRVNRMTLGAAVKKWIQSEFHAIKQSPECTALRILLDAQNDRLIKVLKVLGQILQQMNELVRELASNPALSQEFLNPDLEKENAD